MLINSPNISGSLTVTGNATISGSLNVAGGINATITGSATSASYVEYSNVANKPTLVSGSEQISFNGIVDKPTLVSGSSQVTYSGLSGIPVGIVSGSSQVSFNGIVDKPTLISGSSQITYSEISSIPVGIVSSSTQITGYNLFATTGSNQFNGSQAITGSLTVTGQVVAQTLNVQQVTSSIVFSSGSNIFGNSLSNTQQFTGSVSVTGSLIATSGLQVTANNNALGTNNTLRFTDTDTATEANQQIGRIEFFSSDVSTPGAGVKAYIGAFAADTTPDAYIAFATQDGSGTPDPVERVRISSEGNIGIGTNSPSYRLDIQGSAGNIARITDGTSHFLFYAGSGLNEIATTGPLLLTVSGSEHLRITSGGNVGIGTTSPTAKLQVVGEYIRLVNSADSQNILLHADTSRVAVSAPNGNLAFDTANAERMRITSGGNVGIGTTSPSSRLQVGDLANTSGVKNDIFITGDTVNTNEFYARLIFGNSTQSGGSTASIRGERSNGSNFATSLTFFTNGTASAGDGSERMRLDALGNLGLGVVPSAWGSQAKAMQLGTGAAISGIGSDIHVSNGIFYDGSNWKYLYSGLGVSTYYQTAGNHIWFSAPSGAAAGNNVSLTQAMTLDASGRLGIGTTSPSGALHLKGANGLTNFGNQILQIEDSTNNFSGIVFSGTNGSNAAIRSEGASTMTFWTASGTSYTERMRITSGGNVGIGTTTSAWSLGKTLQIGGDNGAINFSGTAAILGIVNAYYNGSSYIHQNTGTVASFEYGLASANAFNWRMSPSANAGSTASLGIVMSLTNAGNLGIGTPSPANTLHVAGIGRIDTGLYFVNGGTGGAFVWNIANESLRFGTNDTERMRITSGGNVGIGTTSPAASLDINGNVRYRGGIYNDFTFNASGNYSNGTYYNILEVNQITNGIYILEGFVDTYAAGGGIYFSQFASVPFFVYVVGSNSTTFVDLPPVLGTGHHLGNPFPLFRLQMTLAGAGIFLQFNPNASWSGIDGSSGGKIFTVRVKRIGG